MGEETQWVRKCGKQAEKIYLKNIAGRIIFCAAEPGDINLPISSEHGSGFLVSLPHSSKSCGKEPVCFEYSFQMQGLVDRGLGNCGDGSCVWYKHRKVDGTNFSWPSIDVCADVIVDDYDRVSLP